MVLASTRVSLEKDITRKDVVVLDPPPCLDRKRTRDSEVTLKPAYAISDALEKAFLDLDKEVSIQSGWLKVGLIGASSKEQLETHSPCWKMRLGFCMTYAELGGLLRKPGLL